MPKLSNEKKLEALRGWLAENRISYRENYVSRFNGTLIDLFIPKYKIAVHVGDSNAFYNSVKKRYRPFFIRDTETKAFVLEKMQNLIIACMTQLHNSINHTKSMKNE